jgi:hypothetical protein
MNASNLPSAKAPLGQPNSLINTLEILTLARLPYRPDAIARRFIVALIHVIDQHVIDQHVIDQDHASSTYAATLPPSPPAVCV